MADISLQSKLAQAYRACPRGDGLRGIIMAGIFTGLLFMHGHITDVETVRALGAHDDDPQKPFWIWTQARAECVSLINSGRAPKGCDTSALSDH